MALKVPAGTKNPKRNTKPSKKPAKGPKTRKSVPAPVASVPQGGKKAARKDPGALNPPFDARMRSIGSPLNRSSQIRRGWIQAEDTRQRVNFLYNVSQLDLSHQVDPNNVVQPAQKPPDSVTDPFYTMSASTTGVKLLYDRTYELFSAPASGSTGFANKYGVWADVAAWYVYMGMLPSMPKSWDDSIITSPATLVRSYLFVGPNMVFYGWPTGINVTYSHWTQNMIPQRCSVDIGFQIIPHTGAAPAPVGGLITGNAKTDAESSWLSEYYSWAGF
jgi:hypothetical protein